MSSPENYEVANHSPYSANNNNPLGQNGMISTRKDALPQDKEEAKLIKMLRQADTNNDGTLSEEEILAAFRKVHSVKKQNKWMAIGLVIAVVTVLLLIATMFGLTFVAVKLGQNLDTAESSMPGSSIQTDKNGNSVLSMDATNVRRPMVLDFETLQNATALKGLRTLSLDLEDKDRTSTATITMQINGFLIQDRPIRRTSLIGAGGIMAHVYTDDAASGTNTVVIGDETWNLRTVRGQSKTTGQIWMQLAGWAAGQAWDMWGKDYVTDYVNDQGWW